jgi:nucleoid-associated protein YgaU
MLRFGLPVALLVVATASSSPAVGERVHVVQPGDTLWRIAADLAGNPHLWPELYRANRDQIKDPSVLHPGQRLTIPDFEGKAAGPDAAPPAPSTPPSD